MTRGVRQIGPCKVPGAKLSDHDVVVIRQAKGKATQKEVADQFGVTTSCVSHIQRGAHRTW